MTQAALQEDYFEDVSNPLDSVEEILIANDWTFDRMAEDRLSVVISGKMGDYTLSFHWQEDYSALRFFCDLDVDIGTISKDAAARAMSDINSGLWLGHFAFREGSGIPCFRHTSLFRGQTQSSGTEPLEDLVDIALSECERYYAVFDLLAKGTVDENQLSFALTPARGEA